MDYTILLFLLLLGQKHYLCTTKITTISTNETSSIISDLRRTADSMWP